MIDSIAHFVETLTDDQKRVLYLLSGYALELQNEDFNHIYNSIKNYKGVVNGEKTVGDVYQELTDEQKEGFSFILQEAENYHSFIQ